MTKAGIARVTIVVAALAATLIGILRFTGLAVMPTTAERHRALPGDALVPHPADVVMHATTINAPPACVWPWLVQMGAGRAGWYSYDWVDNDSHPSARGIIPSLQTVSRGDVFPALNGVKTAFIVGTVIPRQDLVLTVPSRGGTEMVSWEFFLEPLAQTKTRLLVRGRVSADWPGSSHQEAKRPIEGVYRLLAHTPRWLMQPVAEFGHGIMQARQLQQIKQRAEAGCLSQRTRWQF